MSPRFKQTCVLRTAYYLAVVSTKLSTLSAPIDCFVAAISRFGLCQILAAVTQASLHAYRVLVGKSGGNRPLGRLVVDGRIISERIFMKLVGGGGGLYCSGSG